MMPTWMMYDILEKFDRCLINNGDGTYTLNTTSGSLTGTNFKSVKRYDTMKAFDKTIQGNAIRVA